MAMNLSRDPNIARWTITGLANPVLRWPTLEYLSSIYAMVSSLPPNLEGLLYKSAFDE
jgi:hypothetical protein